MNPKVSILIPCYNAERWIAQAIESALNQTYPNKEVIVVDDGSTDNSLSVIESFGDRLIWETGENKGGNVARNRLLELSTGEWIQYLDSDDYLLDNKIEKQVDFLAQFPSVDIIYSPSIFEYWEENDAPQQEILDIPKPHDPWFLLALWHLPQTGSPLWKKSAILEVGGWKTEQPCCQEHELYLRLLKANKQFLYCDQAQSVYRQWSDSTVCKKDKSLTYKHRLQIIDDLESHLKEKNLLNDLRLHAINESRFACARLIWLFNKSWANDIIKKIHLLDTDFEPPHHLAPSIYKLIYKVTGFEAAETFAKIKRSLTSFY
ncbi:MAG: glycosyltransferase [Limnothrix sp.]